MGVRVGPPHHAGLRQRNSVLSCWASYMFKWIWTSCWPLYLVSSHQWFGRHNSCDRCKFNNWNQFNTSKETYLKTNKAYQEVLKKTILSPPISFPLYLLWLKLNVYSLPADLRMTKKYSALVPYTLCTSKRKAACFHYNGMNQVCRPVNLWMKFLMKDLNCKRQDECTHR